MSQPVPQNIPEDIPAWRREKRSQLIAERHRFVANGGHDAGRKIASLVSDLLRGLPTQTIGAYWPIQAEVDLRATLHELSALGWTIALPAVVQRRAPLEFLRWTAEMEMEPGAYGIPVPRIRERVTPTIVIAPLVGFDVNNYRLGYGSGFFDITIGAMSPRPQSIGVGYTLSSLETIHPAVTDIPMDFIVTETGVRARKEAAKPHKAD